ncbi:hypothetical protein ACLVWU_08450 [Bdellovibrio sp. HCB290]|uniref:hypothetical protein n=1 Tax=Bdellovibrio sp. HCB290 TaxID=3394356 RepID=UPI0039B6395A
MTIRSLLILMTICFAQIAFADCQSILPLEGKFRLIEKTEPSVQCDTGSLKVKGCVLKVFNTDPKESQKIESVYGNPEVCSWKKNEIREVKIGRRCCDIGYRISCADGKDGMYSKEETDQEFACMTDLSFYVEKYKRMEKGKSVQRIYNEKKKAFEDAPRK